jgi:hypothetical protein
MELVGDGQHKRNALKRVEARGQALRGERQARRQGRRRRPKRRGRRQQWRHWLTSCASRFGDLNERDDDNGGDNDEEGGVAYSGERCEH